MQKQVAYSKAIPTKYPEQVVVAISKAESGICNPITLGWTMIVSHEPPMMAIAVAHKRYSLEAIRHAGEFVIAFPSEHQEEEVMLFGTKSGRDLDKLSTAQTKTQPASGIGCVLMTEAVANFECKLVNELITGDHVVLVGEIVASHVNEQDLNRIYTVGAGYKMGGLGRCQ